tara:strand:- start:318 stop:497 length:180 start_codon:yes stop_codon:yes gene_type:complete
MKTIFICLQIMAAIAAMIFGVGMIDSMNTEHVIVGAGLTIIGMLALIMYTIILTHMYDD